MNTKFGLWLEEMFDRKVWTPSTDPKDKPWLVANPYDAEFHVWKAAGRHKLDRSDTTRNKTQAIILIQDCSSMGGSYHRCINWIFGDHRETGHETQNEKHAWLWSCSFEDMKRAAEVFDTRAPDRRHYKVLDRFRDDKFVKVLERCWCTEARRAVETWIACARSMGIAKDIRGIIASKVWLFRFTWYLGPDDATIDEDKWIAAFI